MAVQKVRTRAAAAAAAAAAVVLKKNLFRSDNQKSENGPFIPFEMHVLFETSLLNLVGSEKLPCDLCGEEVFKKIRLKFNNAIAHLKTRKKVSELFA